MWRVAVRNEEKRRFWMLAAGRRWRCRLQREAQAPEECISNCRPSELTTRRREFRGTPLFGANTKNHTCNVQQTKVTFLLPTFLVRIQSTVIDNLNNDETEAQMGVLAGLDALHKYVLVRRGITEVSFGK
jgi:hypothetical protein